jgi:hypothetical protein
MPEITKANQGDNTTYQQYQVTHPAPEFYIAALLQARKRRGQHAKQQILTPLGYIKIKIVQLYVQSKIARNNHYYQAEHAGGK